jgi:hypothetical protein
MYNLDEKGVALGVLDKVRIIARRGTRGFQLQGELPIILFSSYP